jgi:hypothetical protein
MLLALSALLMQAGAAVKPEEIIVSTRAAKSAERVRRFIERVSPSIPRDRPPARFTDPICVGSSGLPPAAGQAIVDRVSEIALSVGLRIGAPGCAPNVLVLFVVDGRAEVRKLARRGSAGLDGQSLADIDRILDEPGPVHAWTHVATLSRDGDRPSRAANDAAVLTVATSTRLSSMVRRDIVRSTILIDRDAVANRDLRQVADYAAMRALTGARPSADTDASSILAAFAPNGKEQTPQLTEFDQRYLEGLYAGRADIPWSMKKDSIATYMVRGGAETRAR